MAASGHARPSPMNWRHSRCTPDTRRLAAHHASRRALGRRLLALGGQRDRRGCLLGEELPQSHAGTERNRNPAAVRDGGFASKLQRREITKNPARITSTRAKTGSRQEVAETPPPVSNWPCARPQLYHGDAGDREQPADNQFWGHAVAKEQHARYQGEHRKQQTERRDAAHRATGDQPEPEAEPDNSSDENRVGQRQPTAFIRCDKTRQLPMFKQQ